MILFCPSTLDVSIFSRNDFNMFSQLRRLSVLFAQSCSDKCVCTERGGDVGRGDLADGLPSTSKDLAAGGDIRVDFHVWMRSEDAVKRWSSFISYLSFIVLVSFCRFQLAGQALDADLSVPCLEPS